MKANFALSLSSEGIQLLHRAAGGWRFVGDVALGEADLSASLQALRARALELEPGGLRSKLILPQSQIRYLTIDADGLSENDLNDAARAALDGATPYAVDDLVFDLSPDGAQMHIAAVARETLAEAEGFALEHQFDPISIVAVPEDQDFLGEPFFGATEHAANLLVPGQVVQPDGIAVVVLEQFEGTEAPVVEFDTDTDPTAEVVDTKAPEPPAPAPDDPEAGDADAAPAFRRHRDVPPEPATVTDAVDIITPQDSVADAADTAASDPADPARPSEGGFVSRRRTGETPDVDPTPRRFDAVASSAADIPPPPSAPEPPFATDSLPEPDWEDVSEEPGAAAEGLSVEEPEPPRAPIASDGEDDLPPRPAMAVLRAFLNRGSRRDAADPAPDPDAADLPATPAVRISPPVIATRPSSLPPAPPALAATARRMDPLAPRVARPATERERMTVFGARVPDMNSAGDRTSLMHRPGVLGLMMSAVLLVFLAGVAAWAAVFMDNGLGRLFSYREPEPPALAQDLGLDAAPAEEAPAPEPDIDVAALSIDDTAPSILDEPEVLAEPIAPPAFDPEAEKARYAVTGIWTIPPDVPTAPGLLPLDDLYMTSIDPANLSFDAVALTPQANLLGDVAPRAPANPAPAGTVFNLDQRGLVVPTPDGALSPEGILVYLGQPPVVPPNIPTRAEPVDPVETETEEIDAARAALANTRPRLRPEDLVENAERQQLGGLSRDELSGFRPRLRPPSVQEQAAEDAASEEEIPPGDQDAEVQAEDAPDLSTATALAVANSSRPSARPSNFERIVTRATRQRARQNTREETTQVAAIAPRTVTPSIPSRTSVTREATTRNAINLNRINLMGVYGTPSDRRALVRLSNGRYKKVQVGDRIDGGRVNAINEGELSYKKGNRNIVLKMPRT